MAAKPKKREKEEKEGGTGRGKTTVETFAGDEAAKWGNGAQADKRGVRVCVCAGVCGKWNESRWWWRHKPTKVKGASFNGGVTAAN